MNDFQKFLDEALKEVDIRVLQEPEIALVQTDISSEIGNQVFRLRKESGLTQAQLAEMVGLSQSKISALERGVSCPKVETLKKIANALGRRLTVSFREWEEFE